MGRFYAIVMLLAACGDNEQGPILVDTSHEPAGAGASFAPRPRQIPQICGSVQWDAGALAQPGMQISVATAQTDLHVIGIPEGGGQLEGLALEASSKEVVDVGPVAASTVYTNIGMNRVAGHLVTAGTDGVSVHVTLLDNNFGNQIEIGKIPGTQVVPRGVLVTDGERLVPVATDTSVGIQAFDTQWNIGARRELGPTDNTKGFTATQLGSAMLMGWSTADTCYLATVFTSVGAQVSQVNYPCPGLQIAGNAHDGTATMVFEASDGIHLSNVSAMHTLGSSKLIRARATSPRALTDGQGQTWISYIDERGDVVVGFVGGDGVMISTAVTGTSPNAGAYDLAMFDGTPWVIALDGQNLTASRMCVVSE
jgi:hypothetical protein